MIAASQPTSFQSRRLAPAASFSEASALVEEALGQLRSAEASLERQLNSLRDYIDLNREIIVSSSSILPQ